jgi:ADP-ribose pyrophosphatase YjhB (NUDIX family)
MKEVSRAIIMDEEGKVLLGKRGRGIGEGLYALIRGKPDQGESAEEAIVR